MYAKPFNHRSNLSQSTLSDTFLLCTLHSSIVSCSTLPYSAVLYLFSPLPMSFGIVMPLEHPLYHNAFSCLLSPAQAPYTLQNGLGVYPGLWYMSLSHSNCWDISTFSGEGNGKPLQYSCLENPVDRGAWWAAVHRVAQGRTRLKWLSSSSSIDIFCVCVCVCVCVCACSCLLPSTLLNPKSEYLSIHEYCLFHICKFSSGPVPAI